jgi:hypothetical protein
MLISRPLSDAVKEACFCVKKDTVHNYIENVFLCLFM